MIRGTMIPGTMIRGTMIRGTTIRYNTGSVPEVIRRDVTCYVPHCRGRHPVAQARDVASYISTNYTRFAHPDWCSRRQADECKEVARFKHCRTNSMYRIEKRLVISLLKSASPSLLGTRVALTHRWSGAPSTSGCGPPSHRTGQFLNDRRQTIPSGCRGRIRTCK
jgi:hypothetical protein